MTSPSPTLLVVAKAPIPGLAKTRLAATLGPRAAAELAAAALLDTLTTARATGLPLMVAMAGELHQACRAAELRTALAGVSVVPQTTGTLGERLVAAHRTAERGGGVVQVGMDTPQLQVRDYAAASVAVSAGRRVIGPSVDGGWWLLGLPAATDPSPLADVAMSQPDTCAATASAFGGIEHRLALRRDLDHFSDVAPLVAQLSATDFESHFVSAAAQWSGVRS